ncbi:peptidase family M1-domain-containing protein [Mycena capillaripes]|nr:peptidase family M1-domain-containing protein [Mycena capillaripes]
MSSDPSPVEQDKYRLPTNVKPSHYNLTFWTDLESLEFGGFVTVDLDILKETSAIILNCSDELNLGTASIHCTALEGDQLQSLQIANQEGERVTLNFLTALPTGCKAQLKIDYNAKLRGSLNGYYKSAWKKDGKTEHYALTHFQPTDARAAFPCFDEPALKSTWTITMISRSDTVNISNMAVESEVVYDPSSAALDTDLATLLSSISKDVEWKITKFQKTPPMSSYLVAFANGPFAHLETKVVMPLSGRTVPLRVYATPDIIHQAEFCLDVTAKVLPLYEKIFDIEYPLPKLDTLAVNDFDMGAMENWGLITGRATAFLLDSKKADIASQKFVARVQSHEVAHMWFGNITTMEWWDYLYLNEGFASLMGEAIVLGEIFPEWEVNSTFISMHLNRGLTLDAKQSSHPIEVKCPDANFINQIFDSLSYSKAASVLRMLSDYIGEERFLKGVSLYLKNHLHGNTVTRDLWAGISTATGKHITRLMNNWIVKTGFPLITVAETSSGIHVRQDRFLTAGTIDTGDETIWSVPLAILTVDKDGKASVDKSAILEEKEKTFAIDVAENFKLNAGTTGFYRVLYTPERLSKIAAEAAKEDSAFSLSDRIGLIYDVSELAKAGMTKLSSLFTLVDIWRNETNSLVWASILTGLNGVLRTFQLHPQIDTPLRAFMRTLFVPLVQRLGYEFPEGESVDIVQLRKTAVQGAANGRDESVTQELRSRFAEYMKTGEDTMIPSNIKGIIFAAAARVGGREEFEALLNIIENSVNPADQDAAIATIGFTQDLSLVEELFSYILTKARDQDVASYFLGLEANPFSRRLLAQFFKDNYDIFSKRFATNSMLKYLVAASFRSLATQEDHDSTEEFFKDKDTSRYSMALAQALETIRDRIAYIERSRDDLSDWLIKWEQCSQI